MPFKSAADEHLDAAFQCVDRVRSITIDPSNPLNFHNARAFLREATELAMPSEAIAAHRTRAIQVLDRMIADNNNFPHALHLSELKREFSDAVGDLRLAIREAGPSEVARHLGLDW